MTLRPLGKVVEGLMIMIIYLIIGGGLAWFLLFLMTGRPAQ